MNIAILGGSSEIARDLVLKLGNKYSEFNLFLYTRNREKLQFWLSKNYFGKNINSESYAQFGVSDKKIL